MSLTRWPWPAEVHAHNAYLFTCKNSHTKQNIFQIIVWKNVNQELSYSRQQWYHLLKINFLKPDLFFFTMFHYVLLVIKTTYILYIQPLQQYFRGISVSFLFINASIWVLQMSSLRKRDHLAVNPIYHCVTYVCCKQW